MPRVVWWFCKVSQIEFDAVVLFEVLTASRAWSRTHGPRVEKQLLEASLAETVAARRQRHLYILFQANQAGWQRSVVGVVAQAVDEERLLHNRSQRSVYLTAFFPSQNSRKSSDVLTSIKTQRGE
jgi:hypothetical protein